MPTKNVCEEPELYFMSSEGKLSPIGRITEVDLTSSEEPYMDLTSICGDMTMTFEANIKNVMLLRYLAGFVMPNNWLKMHGFPMERRRR